MTATKQPMSPERRAFMAGYRLGLSRGRRRALLRLEELTDECREERLHSEAAGDDVVDADPVRVSR